MKNIIIILTVLAIFTLGCGKKGKLRRPNQLGPKDSYNVRIHK